jgi:hypothetical protein
VNPAFKVAQPLPALMAALELRQSGTLRGRAAALAPSLATRLDQTDTRLAVERHHAAAEPIAYNSLCKSFAFTDLPQLV